MKTTLKTYLVTVFLLASCAAELRATPLNVWTWRNPLPTGNQLVGITYGNNLFVAVGTNSTILTSPDGVNWNQQTTPPDCSLSGVTYSPNPSLFVAVGVDTATETTNVILTSTDGINWIQFPRAVGTGGLVAVASDGARNFVALGTNGGVWYSINDSSSWQEGTTPVGAQNWNAVAYGDSLFVAVGNDGQTYYSITGSSWLPGTISPATTSNLYGIAYHPGIGFVAVGFTGCFFSSDGQNWSTTTNSFFVNAVVYGDGIFVVGNNQTYYPSILSSPDGQNWTPWDGSWLFDAFAYGNGTFVGVGPTFANSTEGTNNWNTISSSVNASSLNAVVCGTTIGGTNLFVVGGSGDNQTPAVVTSTNGFNWQLDTDPSIDNEVKFYDSFINGLASGEYSVGTNHFVAFVATVNTTPGFIYNWASVIIYSSNAVVWTTNYISSYLLNGITYGVNAANWPVFVAVGNTGWVVWSTNASSWNFSPTAFLEASGSSLNAVTCGATGGLPLFVTVGAKGTILTSTDGATWTLQTSGTTTNLDAATYGVINGNGLFVAVGAGGNILTSSGGVTWSQQTSGTTANLSGVTFDNGLFVTTTDANGTGAGILVSTNGVNWTPSSIVSPNSLNAVAFGNNQFIAVGNEATILGSVLSAITPGQYVNGVFTITVSGPPGNYAVYVSRDLINWTPLETFSLSSTIYSKTLTDPSAGNYEGGYYYVGPAP